MLTKQVMDGIGHELAFWKDFVQTPRFIDGWVADIKTPEFRDEVYNWLCSLPAYPNLQVLDVGSGAVSIINGSLPKENITTVDPLGTLYPIIFDYARYGLRPPIGCGGEEMDFDSEFDVAHISNAIDHTQNPENCFKKMMRAVKSGGYVVVQGFEDEAISENWEGFHQYNFSMDPQSGIVSYSKKDGEKVELVGEQVYINRSFSDHMKKWWIISIYKKH